MSSAEAALGDAASGQSLRSDQTQGIAARRTSPLSLIVGAIGSVQQAIFPAIAATVGIGIEGSGLLVGLAVAAAVIGLGSALLPISRLAQADLHCERAGHSRGKRHLEPGCALGSL